MRVPALVAVVLLGAACSADASHPRNLVLVTADAFRADRLRTPSTRPLDAFLEEALVFERCLSSSPSTAGAIATVMTGHYAHSVGSPGPARPLTTGEAAPAILAEVLRDAGWQTAAFVASQALAGERGWARGFDHFRAPERGRATRDDYDVARAARRWLLLERESERSFFLWVHLSGGHGPYALERDQAYDALRPFRRELEAAGVAEGRGRTLTLLPSNRGRDGVPLYQQAGPRGRSGDESHYRTNHELRLARTAFLVGELRHVLKVAGLSGETALVFHGTSGEALGERGVFFQHGAGLHAEDLAVPLALWAPGARLQDAARLERVVSTLDLFPTLLALLRVAPPVEPLGDDLLSPGSEPRGWAFSETYPPSASERRFALTTETWKVLQVEAGRGPSFYDLRAAPSETEPLAGAPRDASRQVLEAFEALVGPLLDSPGPAPTGELSPPEANLWRGLGYDL